MEQAELDVALEELETRLERLRALYEQYFMGIEKIEPSIARKDVDRRIYVLRREKIRNTAKRFKLQTIIQRYNTFQQYWQRICREIENGTYKRHLLRAQKNGELLTIAARKRLGKQAVSSEPPAPAESAATPASAPPGPASAPPDPTPASPAAQQSAATATIEAPAALPPRPLGSPPLPPRRPPLPATRQAGAQTSQPQQSFATEASAAVAPAAAQPPPVAPQPTSAAKFESLDLDMDFMSDWDPSARRPNRAQASKASAVATSPAAPKLGDSAVRPIPEPKATAAAAASAGAARSGSVPPRPVSVPPRPSSSAPPRPPARGAVPPPQIPGAPRPVRAPGAPSPPASPAAPVPKAAPPSPKPAPSPMAAKPAAPTSAKSTATASPTAAKVPTPSASSAGSFDDVRLRDLHSRLQQAKQQTKEAGVSYEGLAKSIRATEAKLREQHKNRKIDFDVVIKDGKAIVKPIVR